MLSECVLSDANVRLRPVQERDLPRFVEWLAVPALRRWLALPDVPDLAAEREWLEEARQQEDRVVWAIETLDGDLLGNCDLFNVDESEERGEFGIAIMDTSRQEHGFGTAALRCVLTHAFGELGLRRLSLTVDADNARAIHVYERCGFLREGLLRAYRLRGGAPVDALIMAVLRKDWLANA